MSRMLAIDVPTLQQVDVFADKAGFWWNCSWKDQDHASASIAILLENERGRHPVLRFYYTIIHNTDPPQAYDYPIGLVQARDPCGGERWSFRCPLAVGNRPCRRRVQVLYLPPTASYFGCRRCHGLSEPDAEYEALSDALRALAAAEGRLLLSSSPATLADAVKRFAAARARLRQVMDTEIAKAQEINRLLERCLVVDDLGLAGQLTLLKRLRKVLRNDERFLLSVVGSIDRFRLEVSRLAGAPAGASVRP